MGIQPVATPADAAILGGLTSAAPTTAAPQGAALRRDSQRLDNKRVEHREGTKPADPEQVQRAVHDAVKRANEAVHLLRSHLKFTVDESTGIQVVKFIDITTKEVIRQIPSEEMLALARRLDEVTGLLIKDKA